MTRTFVTLSVGLLLFVSGLAPVSAQDDPPAEENAAAALSYTLRLAPPGTWFIGVSDWARMKSASGLDILNSSIPEDLRIPAMTGLTRDEAPFAGYAIGLFVGHADA
jgi:hypothetical protein